MGLELHSYKIGTIRVHTINSDKTVTVGRYNVPVGLELNACDMGSWRWLNNIGPFEESIFTTMPEC